MSHLRRVGGRFVTHDAHSIYTRALVAPSETWTQQWVTPAGMPAGSKYKVLKWALSKQSQEFSDEDSDDEEIEGLEDNAAPTLVLPSKPTVAPSPQLVKVEPSPAPEATATASASTLVEGPTSSSSSLAPPPSAPAVEEEPTVVVMEGASSSSAVADSIVVDEELEPASAVAALPPPSLAEDIVVDSPAMVVSAAGEASVLPSGEMAITSEDGEDPVGEGRRIAEASLEGPPPDGSGTPPVVVPVQEEVVAAPVEPVVEEMSVDVPMAE